MFGNLYLLPFVELNEIITMSLGLNLKNLHVHEQALKSMEGQVLTTTHEKI